MTTETNRAASKVNGGSLVGDITHTLVNDIVTGHYKPGERLRHQELTARFGVSFGPIREAILKLEQHRLVEILPRRGARVVTLTVKDIEDMLAIRTAMFPVIARSAVVRGSDDELDRFKLHAESLANVLRADGTIEEISRQAVHAVRQFY